MSRTTVTFNGTDLTTNYHVSNIREKLLPREISAVEVPGMDGEQFAGTRLNAKELTLTLTAISKTLAGRRSAARSLAAILAVDKPKALSISADSGLYYLAIPTAQVDTSQFRNAARFDVTFRLLDPVMYGDEKTVNLTNSSNKTFTVGGTYPTYPVFTSSDAEGRSSSGQYIQINDAISGETLKLPVPYGEDTHTVTIDCANRTATVDNVVTAIDLSSDWLTLKPGSNTLRRIYGTGTFTVTWRERWL